MSEEEQPSLFDEIEAWSRYAEIEHQFNMLVGKYSQQVWNAFVELERRHDLILNCYLAKQGHELFMAQLSDLTGRKVTERDIRNLENGLGAWPELFSDDPVLDDTDRDDITTYIELILVPLWKEFGIVGELEAEFTQCVLDWNRISVEQLIKWLNPGK